jgi:hypothetical protein
VQGGGLTFPQINRGIDHLLKCREETLRNLGGIQQWNFSFSSSSLLLEKVQKL